MMLISLVRIVYVTYIGDKTTFDQKYVIQISIEM